MSQLSQSKDLSYSYSFDQLISKADTGFIDNLLPKGAALIIRQLDPNLMYPSKLSKLLLELRSPESLLLDKNTKNEFIDLLPTAEAKKLYSLFSKTIPEDIYASLKNLTINKEADKIKYLQFFGLTYNEEEKKVQKPNAEFIQCSYGLFDHQIQALNNVRTILKEDGSKVLLHMPTGSGKTRTAVTFACEHLRERKNKVVIWLANSEELCEQAYEEFRVAWSYLGNRTIESVRFWGDSTYDTSSLKDGFIVVGLAKAYADVSSGGVHIRNLSARNPLVIFDEAHQAIATTYKFVTELLLRPHSPSKLLGLSATPGRSLIDIDKDLELSKFFNSKKVTLTVEGYSNPVQYLIDMQYLAKPSFRSITSGTRVDLTDQDKQKLLTNLEIPKRILDLLADDQKRNLLIVHEAEQLLKNHNRVILFASSVAQSDLLACVLKARGLNAQSITSNTLSLDRNKFISLYKNEDNEPRLLCNFGILTTGFDAPRTSAAIIARPTISLVLYSQMIGRAMRGVRAGGNAEAEIVTIIDEGIEQFKSIEAAFSNWEDVWTETKN